MASARAGIAINTVVYQSYRTTNVPDWIGRCMATVRDWAALQGFDYHFVDDRMFAYAPDWYRRRVADNVCLVSDLARLLIAKELLAGQHERAIWVDADLVVFDPRPFTVPVTREFAFCREVWVSHAPNGKVAFRPGVNNAVSVFVRGNSILDFYIHACRAIVGSKLVIDRLDVGTTFLTRLHSLVPMALLDHVGLVSPLMADAIVRDAEAPLRAFATGFRSPIHAANLCSSFRGKPHDGVTIDDAVFERVIDRLIESRGAVVNRFLGG